jgi:protein SCO1/2
MSQGSKPDTQYYLPFKPVNKANDMSLPLLRPFFLIITQLVVSLLCTLAMPAAQAHSGHRAHEHKVVKASGSDFTLMSDKGPVALKDFRGKVVAIYFGYSHCLDVCPLDLGKLRDALNSMRPDEVAQIQPIFITVDPARDDAKHLAEYSAIFHQKLLGLTGADDEIAAVAKAYGVTYEKGPINAAGAYDIEHPSDIFLVGRNGELLRSLPQGTSPSSIAAALRKALRTRKP